MQLLPLRFISSVPKFDFIGLKKTSYALSIITLIFSLAAIMTWGFNFGIDFIGGINIEMRVSEAPNLSKMREVLGALNIGEVILQSFGDSHNISIRVGGANEENSLANVLLIKDALKNNFAYDFDYRAVDFVGPQVGRQMIQSGVIALLLTFVAIMIYIWIRFEWQFGLGVLITLVHDAIVSLGLMSVMQYDFNLSTVAAILTVVGYSVNDSVVIYDRIRDNLRKYSLKDINQIINQSINETLSRTTMTVFTTLLANIALVLFGGEAIRSFSILVFFGIFIGSCSSIFIAAPILTFFNFQHFRR